MYEFKNVCVVETLILSDQKDLDKHIIEYIGAGYEGCVLRTNEGPYEYSINKKRSSHIMKCK